MKETEAQTEPANPAFQLPDDIDCYVWRYMCVRKFCSMLVNSGIYLCRADRLEHFEGTYSREQIRDTKDYLNKISQPKLINDEQERRRRDKQ